ncbi:MAG: molybdopterin molybdotransferase MoeA [Desulfomonilia bacterium]|nr:molybdopterin molybdotransferase MoeA [Desulfomonilia bacterium]
MRYTGLKTMVTENLSLEEARETILAAVPLLPPETISLVEAQGRVLAEDVYAQSDIPAYDNSAMDGYALNSAEITNHGTSLRIAYELPAGTVPHGPCPPGHAVKIMTGALIPPGTDTVVMREDTEEYPDSVIIHKVPKRYAHIRFAGEDVKKGAPVLSRGDYLGPAQIGILASLRKPLVLVSQKPLVAILATGDEIIDLGEPMEQGKIPSSNSYTLIALVKESGALPIYLGISKDEKPDLIEKISRGRKADLILTSGGVSMGDYDLVREVLSAPENTLAFWKVNIKPGRPLAFGSLLGIPALGLPGNPVSTMTSFYQFARPALLKMMGARSLLLPKINAILACPIDGNKGDRIHYMRGILERRGAELSVTPTGEQGSGILSSMARGNCFIVLPKGTTHVDQGESVECELFSSLF